jgi:prophage regulatory protein
VRLYTLVCMQKQSHSISQIDPVALLRLRQVLAIVPVSASTWWQGVRAGRFPAPVKLGPRTTCWKASDILALIERVAGEGKRRS